MALDLDFTSLNNISNNGARSDFKGHNEENPIRTTTNTLKAHTEPHSELQGQSIGNLATIKLNREKEDHNRTIEVYKEYQQNIRASESIQTELLKGITAADNVYILLLKACKAISLMTNNEPFYKQIEDDIKAVYGEGLLEKKPLELELEEVKERKGKLEEAYKRESLTAADKSRIRNAIQAHEERIKHITELRG